MVRQFVLCQCGSTGGSSKDLMGAARLEATRPDRWDGCAFDVSEPLERVSRRADWKPPTSTQPRGKAHDQTSAHGICRHRRNHARQLRRLVGAEGHPLGHAPVGTVGPQGAGRPGESAEQGDAASTASRCCRPPAPSPPSRATPPRSSTASTGPTSPSSELRPTPAASRASRRASSAADPVVLVEHDRGRPRDPRRNKDKIKKWADLTGKRVFTGPLPFDTRAQSRARLGALGVKFTLRAGRPGDGRLAARIRRASTP